MSPLRATHYPTSTPQRRCSASLSTRLRHTTGENVNWICRILWATPSILHSVIMDATTNGHCCLMTYRLNLVRLSVFHQPRCLTLRASSQGMTACGASSTHRPTDGIAGQRLLPMATAYISVLTVEPLIPAHLFMATSGQCVSCNSHPLAIIASTTTGLPTAYNLAAMSTSIYGSSSSPKACCSTPVISAVITATAATRTLFPQDG